MKYRKFGKLGIEGSAFGLGCMRFNGEASGDSIIDEQKAKQKDLAQQFKDGEISQEDYYKAMAQSKEVMKTYTRQMQEISKEVQNNIKMDTEQVGSLRALRAELSNLTKQYEDYLEKDRGRSPAQDSTRGASSALDRLCYMKY